MLTRDELLVFIDSLKLMMNGQGSQVHEIMNGDGYLVVYKNTLDAMLVVHPDVKDTLLFRLRGITDNYGKIRNLKIIGGGEKLWSISHLLVNVKCESLDCTDFNICNVTEAMNLFEGAAIDNLDLNWLNNSKLRLVTGMFKTYSGKEINLSQLNTSKVTSMRDMFCRCTAKITGQMDTSNVAETAGMFKGYKNQSELNLRWMDISLVNDISEMFMDCECESINLGGLNVGMVTAARRAFQTCKSKIIGLETLRWDNLVDAASMFSNMGATEIKLVSNSKDINNISGMFLFSKINELDISEFMLRTKKNLYTDGVFTGFKGEILINKRQAAGTNSEGLLKIRLITGKAHELKIRVLDKM